MTVSPMARSEKETEDPEDPSWVLLATIGPSARHMVRGPTTWATTRHDGPNHLGL